MRDNILFHDENVDEKRYRDAMDACCLNEDMKVFVDGDMTEVGEKGVTISGGQKQRIALARAAYYHADVTIVDDALSAMDSHVGGDVFRKCFMGMLKDTTRIFMTNNLMYTKQSDRIFVIEGGKIAEQGTYKHLMQSKGIFFSMMSHEVGMDEGKEEKEDDGDDTKVEEKNNDDIKKEKSDKTPRKLMRKEQKTTSRPSPFFMVTMVCSLSLSLSLSLSRSKLRLTEFLLRQAKSVDAEWMLVIAAICFFVVPTLEWLQNYLLSQWVQSSDQGDISSRSVSFIVAATLYAILASVTAPVYQYFFLRCSTFLHRKMLVSVMSQAMSFFDKTPVGRILNVFAGDMMDLDLTLPRIFRWWQMTVSVTLVALIPAMYVVPMVIPLVLVLILLCVAIYRLYGDVQIEISRLYLMSIGPILSSFSSYVSGLDTIRAFRKVDAFNKKFDVAISGFMNVSYWQAAMDATSQWIVGGPLSSFFFMLPLSLFIVSYDTSPEIAALLLMYGASFSFRLPRGLFMTVQVEKSMVCAQRLVEYIQMKPEPALLEEQKQQEKIKSSSSEVRPMTSVQSGPWKPTRGEIVIRDVSMRYGKDLPLVLRGLNVKIKSGTKVGIVGRTSSCFSLFNKTLLSFFLLFLFFFAHVIFLTFIHLHIQLLTLHRYGSRKIKPVSCGISNGRTGGRKYRDRWS